MASVGSYALCQSACNAAAMTCYASAGVVFGVGSVPICNASQGACMAACATKFGVEAAAEAGATGGFALPFIVLGGLATYLFGGSSSSYSPSEEPSEEPSEKRESSMVKHSSF